MDIKKIESQGFYEIILDRVEIRKLILKIVSTLKTKAIQKGISLGTSVSVFVPRFLYIDSTRIIQILMNLISNSIKYTKKGFVKIYVGWEPNEETIPEN